MADLINVDDVLTHDELDDYLGNQLTAKTHLAPDDDLDTAKVRAWALNEVLAELAERTPPIYEHSVAIAKELTRAVRHAAAMRLYDLAATSGQDAELWWAKMRVEEKRYRAAVDGQRITVSTGVQATTRSIGISRR